MNYFRFVSWVLTLTLFFTAWALDSKDKSKHLISVSRLKEIAQQVNSLDTTWKAEVPEFWIQGDDTLLDLSHLTGTLDPNSIDKNEFKKKKNYDNDDDDDNLDDLDFQKYSNHQNGNLDSNLIEEPEFKNKIIINRESNADEDDDDSSSSEEDDEDEEDKKKKAEKAIQCENNGLPKQFDARKHWPKCNSTISHIYDQGNCGSCWAVSAVAAFTDRLCIQSKGEHAKLRSVQQVLSCCHKGAARDGCHGGWPSAAFDYIRRNGLSTGGDYDSKQGCQPYRIKPCAHHVNGTKLPLCSSYKTETAHKCKLHCYNKNYHTAFKSDRIKVKSVYYLDPCAVMNDIYNNGPVVAAFAVYEDFVTYKKGIYQYTVGNLVGWHATRVIGWGEEKGTPYWLVTNSWNEQWGENGYFKMIRDDPGNAYFQETVAACSISL